jgi:lantibiotic transport system ATP-binding protein
VSDLAVETHGVSHQFRRGDTVLHDIKLAVPRGSIYGFLGPNGAGKTTTLRLLLGLLRCQRGRIFVLGHDLTTARVTALRAIGSLIEQPSLYSHLSAAENLRVWQVIHGCRAGRIDEVLHLVGLSRAGRQPAAQFSLGMRQRLGVGIALLHQPALLMLDEPTNGLDPEGILQMRELLLSLQRDHGVTVLVSSHLLSEVEKIVTHVGVLRAGALVFQDTLEAFRRSAAVGRHSVLQCDDLERARDLLRALRVDARIDETRLVLPPLDVAGLARVNHLLVTEGIAVSALGSEPVDLERQFLALVHESR